MNAMEQKVLLATDGPEDLPFSIQYSPAKRHVPKVESRVFEPPISTVQRRHDTLLKLSDVCKIAANAHISCPIYFPSFQEICSGCCTVAAQDSNFARLPLRLLAGAGEVRNAVRLWYVGESLRRRRSSQALI
jgi:hypothetical protein